MQNLQERIDQAVVLLKNEQKSHGELTHLVATLRHEIDLLRLEHKANEEENQRLFGSIRNLFFVRKPGMNGVSDLYTIAGSPVQSGSDGRHWRIVKSQNGIFKLSGGGEVVGNVPAGLPSFGLPHMPWNVLGSLLSAAIIISLVGYMEAISMAKAIAVRTKQKIDPNQELIGQGLANLVASMSHTFPVSGSFSRSAVNMEAGALTGMSSVFAAIAVLITLQYLMPALYHLPQAVLAAVIIIAVFGLIKFSAMRQAWHVNRDDGVAAVVTFIATLVFAPHLDTGIMIGVALAIGLYLRRTMTPRVAVLGRHPDGTLRDAKTNNLPISGMVTAVRFDGPLFFANHSYFEDSVLEAVAANPRAPYLLVVGHGINSLDASGEESLRNLIGQLHAKGITVVFSGLKTQALNVMRATGLFDSIGQDHIFPTAELALAAIHNWAVAKGQDTDTLLKANLPVQS